MKGVRQSSYQLLFEKSRNPSQSQERCKAVDKGKCVQSILKRFAMSVRTTGTGPELLITQPDNNILDAEGIKTTLRE